MTLIATIVASKPMMTMTSISSTSVKPCSADRRSVGEIFIILRTCKALKLQYRQQDRQDNDGDDTAHQDDDDRLQHRQRRGGEGIELPLQIVGSTRQHRVQLPGCLAACRPIDQQRPKAARPPQRRPQDAPPPNTYNPPHPNPP